MPLYRRCIPHFLALVAMTLVLPGPAQADSADPGYLNFQAQKEKYDQQKKVQMQQGYVLEPLTNKSGHKIGTLSFGGQTRVEDPYQGIGARTNFGARDPNEISGPHVSLRFSF